MAKRAHQAVLSTATLALAMIVLLATGGCTNQAESATPASVTIGMLADASASGSESDAKAIRGAQLVIDIVNGRYPQLTRALAAEAELPSLRGATLALATSDTRGDAREVSDAAAALVRTGHAVALVVAGTSDVAAAAGSEAQRLAVPVIDAGSTADYVTELGQDWYFRVGPSDRVLAETAFAVLRRQVRGPVRIGLLTTPGGSDTAVAAMVKDMAARAGDIVVVDEGTLRPPSRAARTAALNDGRCDVIIAVTGSSAEATEVVKIATDVTEPMPVLGLGSGFLAPGFVANSPVGAKPIPVVLRASPWSMELAERSPAARAVAQLYREKFDEPMTSIAALSFTATMTAAQAIAAAGTADPAAVRAALRRLSFPATQMIMPWNGLRFDANGENVLAAGIMEAWAGSDFRVVYPSELAAGPMIWTSPTGSAR